MKQAEKLIRCPSCREVESQVCNLHGMGDMDETDKRIAALEAEVAKLKTEAAEAYWRELDIEARSELRRVLLRDAGETIQRLTRERDEARQARRMAEEEVQQLRARIRGDG